MKFLLQVYKGCTFVLSTYTHSNFFQAWAGARACSLQHHRGGCTTTAVGQQHRWAHEAEGDSAGMRSAP